MIDLEKKFLLVASMVKASLDWSSDTELVSLVLTVTPKKDVALPTNYAVGLHAWFLSEVQKKDPELSQYLHDGQSEKPFTMSRLFGEIAEDENQLLLFQEKSYQWYVSALSSKVARWFRLWLHNLPKYIILNFKQPSGSIFPSKIYLTIKSVEISLPATTYRNLLGTVVRKKLTLSFLSATSFHTKGHHYPLPDPSKLFHSYLRRWNHFAPNKFESPEFLSWIEANTIITRHHLDSTRVAGGKRGLVTGFVGSVELDLVSSTTENPEFTKLYKALGQLAPYCGTGHKTTFGLGQTRLGWQDRQADISAMSIENFIVQRQREIFEALMSKQKRTGGTRAKNVCQTRAIILARREFGESLKDIAEDLKMPSETVKTYVKLARKILRE